MVVMKSSLRERSKNLGSFHSSLHRSQSESFAVIDWWTETTYRSKMGIGFIPVKNRPRPEQRFVEGRSHCKIFAVSCLISYLYSPIYIHGLPIPHDDVHTDEKLSSQIL